jgi:hypothetical protein
MRPASAYACTRQSHQKATDGPHVHLLDLGPSPAELEHEKIIQTIAASVIKDVRHLRSAREGRGVAKDPSSYTDTHQRRPM